MKRFEFHSSDGGRIDPLPRLFFFRFLASPRRRVATLLTLLLLGISAASAQTADSDNSTPGASVRSGAEREAATEPLRNGYGEVLRPKVKKTPAALKQPYTPIKQQADEGDIPEIEMFVGESRVFPTPGVARIAVGNGQIMTAAALDTKETIIFANGVGTSSLFIWNEDGRYQRVKVNIVRGDTGRIAREVAAFLTAMPNAKASVVGDKVIVEGDELSDADLAKIDELGKRYPQIVNFTNRVGWEQMVMLDVKVVEFPNNVLREVGINWSPVGGGAIGGIWAPIRRGTDGPYQVNIQTGSTNPPPITNPEPGQPVKLPSGLNILSAVNVGLNAQLNLLAQDGKASLLAQPQLSARNGGKASFLAGGEVPYVVSTINGPTVYFKQYGIRLNIEPRVDRNGIVRAKIESEVSAIDPAFSTSFGPALLSRKAETEFNVRTGETIVLSGLIQRDRNLNIDKVPGLGDLPIIGALFRSKRFQNRETELVVFVTPSVVDSRSAGLVDRVEKTRDRLERINGNGAPYLSDPIQPQHDPANTNETPPDRPSAEPAAPASSAPISTGPAASPNRPDLAAASPPAPATPVPGTQESSGPKIGFRVSAQGSLVHVSPNPRSEVIAQPSGGDVLGAGNQTPRATPVGLWRNVWVGQREGWILASHVAPVRLSAANPGVAENGLLSALTPDQAKAPHRVAPVESGRRVQP